MSLREEIFEVKVDPEGEAADLAGDSVETVFRQNNVEVPREKIIEDLLEKDLDQNWHSMFYLVGCNS